MLTQETKKIMCIPFRKNAQEECFIDRKEAIRRFEMREGAEHDNEDVAGFYFSLEILEEFIEKIKIYNESIAGTAEKQATAIRIWQAKSHAFTGEVANGYLVEDLVLTPARGDGSDIHAYPEGELMRGAANPKFPDPLLILSSSRPCPNLCGSAGGPKFFHQYRP